MNVDVIKVWVFYLKGESSIYAFTALKEFKNRFLRERNEKCFNVEKIEMDEFEFSLFMNRHSSYKLSEMPLNTSLTEYVNILMTPKEYEELNHRASSMDSEMERIHKRFSEEVSLKEKYSESVNYLCSTVINNKKKNGEIDRISTINLLFLFMQLFKNTFEKEGK